MSAVLLFTIMPVPMKEHTTNSYIKENGIQNGMSGSFRLEMKDKFSLQISQISFTQEATT